MLEFETNEHRVPQFPKGHAGRLFVVLAAIDRLDRPTATSVANFTGLSKGKIDDYVRLLTSQYGVVINKNGPAYELISWGDLLNKSGVRKRLFGLDCSV